MVVNDVADGFSKRSGIHFILFVAKVAGPDPAGCKEGFRSLKPP